MPENTIRPLLALLGIAILSSSVQGAVAERENLLINGGLEAEQVGFPEFWSPSSTRDVLYCPSGGPEGKKAAIVLKRNGPAAATPSARQQGMTLVAGETYKLSAHIKTKGFKSRYGGIVVHNSGWTSAVGITDLPADSDWTFREKTFTLMPSKNQEYGLALFAVDPAGELHFAGVKLEAVSEAARRGSRSQASLVAAARLVPLQPLLNKIPRTNPEITLRLFGILPEKRDAYECLIAVDGNIIPEQAVPLGKNGNLLVRLAGLPCGDYALKAIVRHRETQKRIVETAYPISIVDVPAIDRGRIRPLNNLVAELLNQPVKNDAAPQSFTFVHPRDGWIFVAFTGAAPAPGLALKIDDRLLSLRESTAPFRATIALAKATEGAGERFSTGRLEALRELPLGEHRITVSGNSAKARLIVRSIPEIFNYPPCANSHVKENGSYGWEFMKKHILYAVTTLNGGTLPGEALGEAKARGLKWLANFGVDPLADPTEVRDRMERHAGMTQPQYDGFTSDELFFGNVTIDNYTRALKMLRNPRSRLIYTWIVGKPSISSLHTDFMSAALNASKGRGRLLFEAYCHPQADERAAAAYLDDMIGETMRRFNAFLPNAAAGTGIIFGNFNQIPIISLEHDPAVDFKYFLDMQVHLVANSPDFKNVATVGYWGTYYADEELVRWSFKLMRHYAVEGNRDMLSARYGFRYNPGFLANSDFAEGLKGWTASPGAEGSLRAATVGGYGRASQGRWAAGDAGDTVCVMVRKPGRPNRISQTAQGLEAGKAYCLQFVTADFKDVTAKKYDPRRYGIRAVLEGAEILGEKSFVHVDRRRAGTNQGQNVGKVNLHRIVFRAKSPIQTIAFDDEGAVPGEELIINFVQLKPYLE